MKAIMVEKIVNDLMNGSYDVLCEFTLTNNQKVTATLGPDATYSAKVDVVMNILFISKETPQENLWIDTDKIAEIRI